MAYSVIKKPSEYFNTKLYTGNGTSQAITGVGFQPDWVWMKDRNSGTLHHVLVDAVRGTTKAIYSNLTASEENQSGSLTAFNSDGFSIGNMGDINTNGDNFASWNWKANGTGVANTDGSISSTVSANTTSGFSIVSYTGSSANSNIGTVGHGLGYVPKMLIVKDRDATSDWQVFHSSLPTNKYLDLNTTDAAAVDTNVWNNTAPTSSVFTVGDNSYTNANGRKFIAYCFADVQGFSKFGSYTGNGSTDGTFVYTGFKPAFVIYKGASGTGTTDNWEMADNKRSPYNGIENVLYPNENYAEGTGVTTRMDFLSNGFKMRTSGSDYNASGSTYIYMAFAEQPLVGDNPATAR